MSQIRLGNYMHSSYKEFLAHGHGKHGPWFDLVNSEEWDTFGRRTEHFENPAWLTFFLRHWRLARPAQKPFPTAKFLALRKGLREACESAAARKRIGASQLRALNGALNVKGTRRVREGQNGFWLEFVAQGAGWDAVLAEAARSFVELLAKGGAERLKICRNPLCKWVFYDQTKAGTRCWCDDKICGNRERVRKSRAHGHQ
jgi:predicted RNA-binding Zn ribbon-like protein